MTLVYSSARVYNVIRRVIRAKAFFVFPKVTILERKFSNGELKIHYIKVSAVALLKSFDPFDTMNCIACL